ncbi:MAG: hypothetical protein JW803_03660 [Endomicrobiales bacterium]|nr:hypothetical protein [Endomicrobiales bacterium]
MDDYNSKNREKCRVYIKKGCKIMDWWLVCPNDAVVQMFDTGEAMIVKSRKGDEDEYQLLYLPSENL